MNTFRDAFRHADFTLTGQLRLHQDSSRDDVLAQARCLSQVVDAVAVTDCPFGVLHMSGLAVASILIQDGIDPVLQLSARDRNRIALKSELLGAAALGVTSLILQRGERLPVDLKPKTTQVFDTGAKKFLATAGQLSEYREAIGERKLLLGTMATVFDPEPGWQPTELMAKINAGAEFVQTQACLDLELLKRYMTFLVGAQIMWHCNVIVSVPVLTTVESARWLYQNARGSVIPENLVRQFENADDPEAFGIDYCAETLRALQQIPGVRGANLSTMDDVEAIVLAVRQAGCSRK